VPIHSSINLDCPVSLILPQTSRTAPPRAPRPASAPTPPKAPVKAERNRHRGQIIHCVDDPSPMFVLMPMAIDPRGRGGGLLQAARHRSQFLFSALSFSNLELPRLGGGGQTSLFPPTIQPVDFGRRRPNVLHRRLSRDPWSSTCGDNIGLSPMF